MCRLNSITEKLWKWRKYWKERTYYELVPLPSKELFLILSGLIRHK